MQEPRDAIQREVVQRGIDCLCHFTPLANLDSILTHGLLPRASHSAVLASSAASVVYPDMTRNDGCLGASSISVTFPNAPLFYKKRCERRDDDWVVLRLDPAVLWTLKCAFVPTNAASGWARNVDQSKLFGSESFRFLFMGQDGPYPFDEQSEVLVFGTIPPEAILALEFDEKAYARWRSVRHVAPPDHVRTFCREHYFRPSPSHRDGILLSVWSEIHPCG